jgi:hypothetical protein
MAKVRSWLKGFVSRLFSETADSDSATEWIDLALIANEEALQRAIAALDSTERDRLLRQFAAVLGQDLQVFQVGLLRILVERARPLALPAALWSRPVTSSSDIEAEFRKHLQHLSLSDSFARLRQGQQMYAQFVVERARVRVELSDLQRHGFRCGHCGLAFCDEELTYKGWSSPFGLRGSRKSDPLKPHWHRDDWREPTVDHDWPVSLYGTNDATNLRVLCKGCNNGKAEYITVEQTKAFTGLPGRSDLLGGNPLSTGVFYAQLRRAPHCAHTGKDARITELTVGLRDPTAPAVLDNLITLESMGR